MRSHLVLARTETNAPDLIGAAIASIQARTFIRRVSWIFDCAIVVVIAVLSGWLRKFSRVDLVIGAVAFSAAYCLIALGIISAWADLAPGLASAGRLSGFPSLSAIVLPKPKDSVRTVTIAASPPVP